ncbi:site-2 protease family protein [Aliiroseovarius sp.]|uniref:site-2 protease family protein n=1 Tax=Aliiroseovarius sp. TaxID=1872442 RepID=UPI003BAC54F0
MNSESVLFEFRGPWGVPIQIGSSAPMLALLIVMLNASNGGVTDGLIFVAILFGSTLLHELGHAWGCHVQGVPVRRVMIYGGGGFCEHARTTTRREDELITAMGPIVNLVLWAAASLAFMNLYLSLPLSVLVLLSQIAWLNLFLAIFNLLPVQPLDGGRLLQLTLMRFMEPRSATKLAGGIGVVLCVLWLPILFFSFTMLGFVLFFFPSFRLHLQMTRQ